MIIAIDGPAGAGKSTVAKEISKKLNIFYLSSGKIYRSIAFYLNKKNISIDDLNSIKKELKNINISINNDELYLNNSPVEQYLNNEIISKNTSKISQHKFIRDFVKKNIRNLAKDKNLVMDGRDIGTVVFPKADYKIFLTASLEERASRRYEELKKNDNTISYDELYNSIRLRDYDDINRSISPLKKAEDAILIDTTNKDINEVISEIIDLINN